MAGDPFDRENPEGVLPTLRGLELRLGLPEGFCEQLLHEDDWSLLDAAIPAG